ncbi:hypothetical protein ABW20_dc0104537 [Dactylellina cionopaga]|nr:hypothetical protein ABW20_dc0104537 [Dactylellina cionopaga]
MLKKPRVSKFSKLAVSIVQLGLVSAAVPALRPGHAERGIMQIESAENPTTDTQTLPWNTKSCSESYFAPWVYSTSNWTDPPKLNITVAGVPLIATVDTGSTGLVASMKSFPDNNFTKQVEASIFYSSSHWLEEGYEEWVDMSFGPYSMRTKMLVKDNEVCCPTFDKTTDGNRCPVSKRAANCICAKNCPSTTGSEMASPSTTESNTIAARAVATGAVNSQTAYMGIGFGRGVAPDANAFLDIISFNGQPISSSTSGYCPGYAITSDGLYLGLTAENTKDVAWTTLSQQDVQGMREWATPPMQYQVDNGAVIQGTILVDTGIPNSYFSATPRWNNTSVFQVSLPGYSKMYTVKYDMGVTGNGNPMQPTAFGESLNAGYINTGRKFLNCFDIAYDPVGGNFGYRYLSDNEKCSA